MTPSTVPVLAAGQVGSVRLVHGRSYRSSWTKYTARNIPLRKAAKPARFPSRFLSARCTPLRFAALRGGRTPADAEEDAVLLRFAASSTAAAGGAP